MVKWISQWCEAIIIAVIIATIIEMILPEGNNKKYIKVVIGVYILFTIISPVISSFTGKSLAVSDILDLDNYINEVKEKEQSQNFLQEENANTIRNIYIGNLKSDMRNKLKSKGYIVNKIELDVGYDDNYTLNKIILFVDKEEEDVENNKENVTVNENKANSIIQTVNEINIIVWGENKLEENFENEDDRKSNLSNKDKEIIMEYLSSTYELSENNIIVN